MQRTALSGFDLNDFIKFLIDVFNVTENWSKYEGNRSYVKDGRVIISTLSNGTGDHVWVDSVKDYYLLFHAVGHIVLRHNYNSTNSSLSEKTDKTKELEATVFAGMSCKMLDIPFNEVRHDKMLKKNEDKNHMKTAEFIAETKINGLLDDFEQIMNLEFSSI